MAGFADDERTIVGELPSPRTPRPRRRPPTLEQIRGPGSPQAYHLFLTDFVIGRGAQAQFVVDCASLSRQHVRISQRDGEVTFVDLDSANGVYLNGVLAYSAVLRDGDLLEMGDCAFIFHERGL
ncbi:MAG: FHA domain-containing protein [Polyangiaceae bacterium]